MNDQNQPCAYEQELMDQYARDQPPVVPPEHHKILDAAEEEYLEVKAKTKKAK